MGVAALMIATGIFLVVAGLKDESVPSILSSVIRGEPIGDIGMTLKTTDDPRTGTPLPPIIPGQITTGGTIGDGVVGRSGRAPA